MRSVVFLLLLSIFIKSSDSVKCEGNPKEKIFYERDNYKVLDLSGCENERLIIDEDLKGRNYLKAVNNVFSKLEANTFVKIPNLLIIDLHDNQIEEISKEAFTGLSKLIDLKYNSIEELKVGTFDPLVALPTLKLEHNKINVLKEGIFDKNLYLTHTHLDDNQIFAVGPTVLKSGKNWYLRARLEIISDVVSERHVAEKLL
jgi:Leucine-rich repeat (LRR) protein